MKFANRKMNINIIDFKINKNSGINSIENNDINQMESKKRILADIDSKENAVQNHCKNVIKERQKLKIINKGYFDKKLIETIIKKNRAKNMKFKEGNCPGYYNLIRINGNRKIIKKKPPKSKYILTNYDFNEAIKYDDRSFWRIFYICLFYRESILHTFIFESPLELKSLRICLFIVSYAGDFTVNALFYSVNKISDRYHYEGDNLYLFSLVNNLTISLCSSLFSLFLRIVLKKLINSNKAIESVFRENEKELKKTKSILTSEKKFEIFLKIFCILNTLKIKIYIFIIIEFCLMLVFTYYVTAFCSVYKKTQTSWLSDCIVSFIMTNVIETFTAFVIAIFYSTSVKYKIKSLYNIALFFYDLGH